jgi:uncharacterized protein
MRPMPESVKQFLSGKRIAVAGVARDGQLPANLIFRRLRDTGHEVFPVNPNAKELEGVEAFPDVGSIPGPIDGVMIATHPSVSASIVREAAARDVKQVWFHRSFGDGSVSVEALAACEEAGIEPIVGGCPLMYCGKVDVAHRCFRWLLNLKRRVPG